MTDAQLVKKIISIVKNSTWAEILRLGVNFQQAQKIRSGKPVTFRQATLDRLRKKLKVA